MLRCQGPGLPCSDCSKNDNAAVKDIVRKNQDTVVTFFLKLERSELKASSVKADNRKIKRLLAGIERNRRLNDPDSRPYYQCEVYDRIELDLTHIRERLDLDTSFAKGLSSLPVIMSESVAKRYHTSSPEIDREVIVANRISGADKDNNLLAQFSGSLYLRANFYKPFINAFGIDFPSPAQKSGLSYYDYFIIDTLELDSRKTYEVRYHPKKGSTSPAFDGEMLIDAGDFAIRSVRAGMQRGGNVNWLRGLALETEYSRVGDSLWFFNRDRMNADCSLALTDSSGLVSFRGSRDRGLKGGLTYEHMFGREPTRKLTLDAHYDVFQLGTGQSEYTSGNIVSSIWQGGRKLSPMSSFSASYEHEFSQSFNAMAWMHLKRHYSNGYVPMKDWAGNGMRSVASNELGVQLRFSREETVDRGYFIKTYLHIDHPVWTIALAGSVPGLRQGDCGFFRPEGTSSWHSAWISISRNSFVFLKGG